MGRVHILVVIAVFHIGVPSVIHLLLHLLGMMGVDRRLVQILYDIRQIFIDSRFAS
jgi:hypothetical protein